ncbi:MAG: LuxR C-terminal-related transcriptional regulator, partial [Dehalococcoidia bacterium]
SSSGEAAGSPAVLGGATMPERTVLLIPSDDFSWSGLRRTLGRMSSARIVGEVTTPSQALEAAGRYVPDIVLLSDAPGGIPATEFLPTLRNCCPMSRLIIFAHEVPDAASLSVMADVAVTACLLWRDLSPAAFEHILALALDARLRFSSEAVAETFVGTLRDQRQLAAGALPLTPRRREVLNLIAQGLTNQEIAQRLGISPNTVGSHVQRIKDHLGVTTRAELIGIALRHGLPER